MPFSKTRLVASGLAIAGFGAIALGYAAPHFARWLPDAGRSAPVRTGTAAAPEQLVADRGSTGAKVDPVRTVATNDTVRVNAPHAAVDVRRDSGKVAVKAPYTNVNVDPDKGRVRVRAPYVDLDIRW